MSGPIVLTDKISCYMLMKKAHIDISHVSIFVWLIKVYVSFVSVHMSNRTDAPFMRIIISSLMYWKK